MNLFTPDDFKNKDGEFASPEAAARIANEKTAYLQVLRMEDDQRLKVIDLAVSIVNRYRNGDFDPTEANALYRLLSRTPPCEETRTKNIWEKLTKIF